VFIRLDIICLAIVDYPGSVGDNFRCDQCNNLSHIKPRPSDRLHNLISLCAQVVRDTDAEVVFDERENSAEQNGNFWQPFEIVKCYVLKKSCNL
jgi:hypothetical protein